MKKHIAFLLLLCFTAALCLPALAEPRYPDQNGKFTDAASVLSAATLEDLRTLDERLDHADALRLYVVTVDFLDGASVEDYAAALFDRWGLDAHELLLLMAVGEDKYAMAAGKDANQLISPASRRKLLAASFESPFMNQQYDAAIADFVPALVKEIGKVCGGSIRTDDLFGLSSESLFDHWTSALRQKADSDSGFHFTHEAGNPDLSVLKVVLIVAVLMLLFGRFRKRGRPRRPARPMRRPARPDHRHHPYPEKRRPAPRRHWR